MNLYYAMGGGLGHLTRARAFLFTLGVENESVILTSSHFGQDKRVVGSIPVIQIDKKFEKDIPAFKALLRQTLAEFDIKTIYLDSFPVGIMGEFSGFDFPDIEIIYVARMLRWKNYAPLIKKNTYPFAKTFILEPLENGHQLFINKQSVQQAEIELSYPSPNLLPKDEEIFQTIIKAQKPFWLIVHSGHESEVLELINYAGEMREIEKTAINLVLISPIEISRDNLFHYDLYPASILFDSAERIFTAGGFNAMNQLKAFKNKHYFIPFERRYDNQFARVAQMTSAFT